MFNGKIHCFNGHFMSFSIAMLNCQKNTACDHLTSEYGDRNNQSGNLRLSEKQERGIEPTEYGFQ